MNLRKMTAALTVIVTALALAACGRDGGKGAAQMHEHEEDAAPTNRVDIPPIVRSNLGITFARVERRRVSSTIRIPGAFEPEPRARREYRMTLPGRIELLVDQYQRVEPGDPLYRVRSPQWPELQHEIIEGEQLIALAEAQIDVALTRLEEARQQAALFRSRLRALASAEVRRADLEAQAAEVEASLPRLEAEVRLARTGLANAHRTREHALHRAAAASGIPEEELAAQVPAAAGGGETAPAYRSIDHIEVRAAAPGVVESLEVTDGGFAETTALVLSTVDPSRIRFRALALQSDLPELARAAGAAGDEADGPPAGTGAARIVPPRAPGIAPGEAIPAALRLGLEADPQRRTITLLATPEQPRPWARPGVSAFLEVETDGGGYALAIPRSAIVQDGVTHVFFRRDPRDPNRAVRVEADMGPSDGRWVAINSGLSLGDEVVVDGAYELRLATSRDGALQRGGHFHADGTFHADDH